MRREDNHVNKPTAQMEEHCKIEEVHYEVRKKVKAFKKVRQNLLTMN